MKFGNSFEKGADKKEGFASKSSNFFENALGAFAGAFGFLPLLTLEALDHEFAQ